MPEWVWKKLGRSEECTVRWDDLHSICLRIHPNLHRFDEWYGDFCLIGVHDSLASNEFRTTETEPDFLKTVLQQRAYTAARSFWDDSQERTNA